MFFVLKKKNRKPKYFFKQVFDDVRSNILSVIFLINRNDNKFHWSIDNFLDLRPIYNVMMKNKV